VNHDVAHSALALAVALRVFAPEYEILIRTASEQLPHMPVNRTLLTLRQLTAIHATPRATAADQPRFQIPVAVSPLSAWAQLRQRFGNSGFDVTYTT
jgi:hypothetical protein